MASSQQETSVRCFQFKCKILCIFLYCKFSRGWFFHKQASEFIFFFLGFLFSLQPSKYNQDCHCKAILRGLPDSHSRLQWQKQEICYVEAD